MKTLDKIYDGIKQTLEDRKDKKAERLTQKIEELDKKIYRTEIDIQGYRDDEMHNQMMLDNGEKVDPYLVEYATKFRQKAERDWLKYLKEQDRAKKALNKIEKRKNPKTEVETLGQK